MALNIVVYTKIMPAMGGGFNQDFLNVVCWLCIGIAFVGVVLVSIGVSEYDRPENFRGMVNYDYSYTIDNTAIEIKMPVV